MSTLPALLMVAAYHLCIGMVTHRSAADLSARKGKEMPAGSMSSMVPYWPGMPVNSVHASDRWNDVLADIQITLDELNSGRWQRVEPAGGTHP
jgi:hypothetical protein